MDTYTIVHYGELRLKGRNRNKFEDKLISNIKKICGGKVEKLSSSLLCKYSDLDKFKYISGISWYASCIKFNKNFDEIIQYFKNSDTSLFHNKKTFALRVKRSDKSYIYNSGQVANIIGDIVRNKTGLNVDLNNPDINIHIEINEYILAYFDKQKGIGGFPNGIHGKVLCLLSGGIDSPVAAYFMMRKGCHVDLVHFHAFTDNKKIKDSKIDRIVRIINKYQLSTRLYVVPTYFLDLNIMNNPDVASYEMLLFRKFIYLVSQDIAIKNSHKALVSGDSLGQVASQTIDNMNVVYSGIKMPLMQPLIAYDKQEIIDISKDVGVYETTIEPYKDCCSILSKNPVTNAKIDILQNLENKLNLQGIVEQTHTLLDCYEY